jgi:hypothetical protein
MANDSDPDDNVLLDSDEISEDHDADPFDDDASLGTWPEYSSVFVLRAKRPFEDWVGHLPHKPGPPQPIDLVMAFATPGLPTLADSERWLAEHHSEMFERFLMPWADGSEWPVDRSFEVFQSWFDVAFSSEVEDMTDVGMERQHSATGAELPAVTCAPLSLSEVRDRFLDLPDDGSLHVDIESGELFPFTDDELEAIESNMDAEVADDDLRDLRDAFDKGTLVTIAYRRHLPMMDLMHDFTERMESGTLRNRLLNALQGRRAARRFNAALDVAGLRPRYERWFRRAVAGLMVISLVELGIPYVDDLGAADEPGPTSTGA